MKKRNFKKSFGLIEVVISIGIFAIFAASIITVISLSSKNIVINKHRLQAANLAREGIELVTEIRDTMWIYTNDPLSWVNLSPGCWNLIASATPKRLEPVPEPRPGLCDFEHWNLVDDSAGQDIDNNGVIFNRKIYINDEDDNTKKIRVVVQWNDNGQDKNVTMVTLLTNWKQ